MANVPFLTPTPYTPPPSPSSNVVEDLEKYLGNVKEIPKSVSPRLKKLQEEIKSIYQQMKRFEVRESDFALEGFAKVYTVDGKLKIDPRSFMDGARENLTEILRNNRNTKVKIILRCYMAQEKDNIIKKFAFPSGIEVNLEGTDEDDINVIMTEKILEKIARHIKGDDGGGSGWTFYKVDKLELHT